MVEFFKMNPDDGGIFTMTLQLTNKIDVYHRTYYKIQDLGAEVGAIYGVLRIVFSILMELYNTSKLFNSIINHHFLIKEEYKPHNKEKKFFINLKSNFFQDLKLDFSFERKNTLNSQLNDNKKNEKDDECKKYKNSLNSENIEEENSSRTKSKNLLNPTDNKNNSVIIDKIMNDIANNKKNSLKNEEKQIKMNFSIIDRLFCLYIIELCKNKVNKYSYYNLFYKGKDYLIKIMDIKNYLLIQNFFEMIFILNGKEKKQFFDYVTKPILSSNYVGMRFGFENEIILKT
jgi:hypothetical protein